MILQVVICWQKCYKHHFFSVCKIVPASTTATDVILFSEIENRGYELLFLSVYGFFPARHSTWFNAKALTRPCIFVALALRPVFFFVFFFWKPAFMTSRHTKCPVSTINRSDDPCWAQAIVWPLREIEKKMGGVSVAEWELNDGFRLWLASLVRCEAGYNRLRLLSGQLVESASVFLLYEWINGA